MQQNHIKGTQTASTEGTLYQGHGGWWAAAALRSGWETQPPRWPHAQRRRVKWLAPRCSEGTCRNTALPFREDKLLKYEQMTTALRRSQYIHQNSGIMIWETPVRVQKVQLMNREMAIREWHKVAPKGIRNTSESYRTMFKLKEMQIKMTIRFLKIYRLGKIMSLWWYYKGLRNRHWWWNVYGRKFDNILTFKRHIFNSTIPLAVN